MMVRIANAISLVSGISALALVGAFVANKPELFLPKAPPPPASLLAEARELAGVGYACRPATAVRPEELSFSTTWVACLSHTDEPDLMLIWGRVQNDFHLQGLDIWLRTDNLEEDPKWNL